MTNDAFEEMAVRVDVLTREIRWYRRLSFLFVLLVALVPTLAGARNVPAERQAQRVALVARDGAPLAALEATNAGFPRLTLLSAGKVRAELTLEAGGTPAFRLL